MKITLSQAEKLVQSYYSIEGTASSLVGYADLNVKITTDKEIFLLKISDSEVLEDQLDLQVKILLHLAKKQLSFAIPNVVCTDKEKFYIHVELDGSKKKIRLYSWVPGSMIGDLTSRTVDLLEDWGMICGEMSKALQDFDHKGAHRFDPWSPVESLYSKKYFDYIKGEDRKVKAMYFWNLFEEKLLPKISQLRKSVNHSDAHDQNILIHHPESGGKLYGVIDFGDVVFSPTISELAIACAYAAMRTLHPEKAIFSMVRGYHSVYPLEEIEMEILYPLICGRLMIMIAHSAYNGEVNPENDYLTISENAAWDLIDKLYTISPSFLKYGIRAACSIDAHPQYSAFMKWSEENHSKISCPIDLDNHQVQKIDLSTTSLDLEKEVDLENSVVLEKWISTLLEHSNATLSIGGYGEIRPFYKTDAYKRIGDDGMRWRTMHLGVDFWVKTGEPIRALLDGEVESIQNNTIDKDYGPTIILKHKTQDNLVFYTLYGHLSIESIEHIHLAQHIYGGETIGWVGKKEINGGWRPHLHFQIILDLMNHKGNFPGVCYTAEEQIWKSICPRIKFLTV